MGLPFTSEQFFAIFAEYNRAFVFVAATLWIATVAMLVFVSRDPEEQNPKDRLNRQVFMHFFGMEITWK